MMRAVERGERHEWVCPKCNLSNVSWRTVFLTCSGCQATFDKLPTPDNPTGAAKLREVIAHRKVTERDVADYERHKRMAAQAFGTNEQGWLIIGTVQRLKCSNCGNIRYDDGCPCRYCESRARGVPAEIDASDGDRL